MKHVKVEWCENFIRAQFTKHHAFPGPNAGIEINCFWKMAEKSGLWERGTYGSPMTEALMAIEKFIAHGYLEWDKDKKDEDGFPAINVIVPPDQWDINEEA